MKRTVVHAFFFGFDPNLMVISLHPLDLVALLSFYAHLCLFAEWFAQKICSTDRILDNIDGGSLFFYMKN